MNSSQALASIKTALASIPRAEVAHVARQALQILGTAVESATPNVIAHEGEVFVFAQLDGMLAKIESPALVAALAP